MESTSFELEGKGSQTDGDGRGCLKRKLTDGRGKLHTQAYSARVGVIILYMFKTDTLCVPGWSVAARSLGSRSSWRESCNISGREVLVRSPAVSLVFVKGKL